MKFCFVFCTMLLCGCLTTHTIPDNAKTNISFDEWSILMNEAAWNLAGKSVDAAQDSQIASYFMIFMAAMANTTSTATSTSSTNVYANGQYLGQINTTTTITYNDPVKEANQAATIAAGALIATSNRDFIKRTNDFLIKAYTIYEKSDIELSFQEWLEQTLNWTKYPDTNYDHNIYVDIMKPFGHFWHNFEFEAGYFYSGIPYFDIGGSLHFYKQNAYTEQGDYISGYSSGYPTYTWHSGYYETIYHPEYTAFSPMLDLYLYTNRYNKGLYLKTSMGPLFQFSNNNSVLLDFRQDIGYKLEFAVTSSPSRGKMFFLLNLVMTPYKV
ncbi:MAG: hypothetical protein MdMp014T_2353 [Treponematales bacterium]